MLRVSANPHTDLQVSALSVFHSDMAACCGFQFRLQHQLRPLLHSTSKIETPTGWNLSSFGQNQDPKPIRTSVSCAESTGSAQKKQVSTETVCQLKDFSSFLTCLSLSSGFCLCFRFPSPSVGFSALIRAVFSSFSNVLVPFNWFARISRICQILLPLLAGLLRSRFLNLACPVFSNPAPPLS